MLDLLGIDLDNNDANKNGAIAADPWGMPIKTQPQPQSQVNEIALIFSNLMDIEEKNVIHYKYSKQFYNCNFNVKLYCYYLIF